MGFIMCGIIGIISKNRAKNIIPMVYKCLLRLEYRGYDSYGFAVLLPNEIKILKRVGAISKDKDSIVFSLHGSVGFAHTRWATHGEVNLNNTHPHIDCTGKIAVVHNGIIVNHQKLRNELIRKGHKFRSNTDTEIVAHLIEEELKKTGNFELAAVKAVKHLEGSFALVIGCSDFPDMLIGFKKESPLILGIGELELFLSSDIISFLEYTNRVIPLEDYWYTIITRDSYVIKDWRTMKTIKVRPKEVSWTYEMAEKGNFDSFMEKEIYEQPAALKRSFYVDEEIIKKVAEILVSAKRVYITASGTSFYAGLVLQYLLKELGNIVAIPIISSEFDNYAVIDKDTTVIFISQSGETADTLSALRYAARYNAKKIGIINVIGSSIARKSDYTIYINAGPEIAVCATKTFLNQLSIAYQIAFEVARLQKKVPKDRLNQLINEFFTLPDAVKKTLDTSTIIQQIAKKVFKYDKAFYIGRGIGVPVAKEGSLKFREITYSFSMSFDGAGELKHGSISLIDKDMFIVAIAQKDKTYRDMLSNIQECKSRGGTVIVVSSYITKELEESADYIIRVPEVNYLFVPIVYIVPLQLLAVYTAKLRGLDPDRPRALAKSVTVK